MLCLLSEKDSGWWVDRLPISDLWCFDRTSNSLYLIINKMIHGNNKNWRGTFLFHVNPTISIYPHTYIYFSFLRTDIFFKIGLCHHVFLYEKCSKCGCFMIYFNKILSNCTVYTTHSLCSTEHCGVAHKILPVPVQCKNSAPKLVSGFGLDLRQFRITCPRWRLCRLSWTRKRGRQWRGTSVRAAW